jgi:hypothetical protein
MKKGRKSKIAKTAVGSELCRTTTKPQILLTLDLSRHASRALSLGYYFLASQHYLLADKYIIMDIVVSRDLRRDNVAKLAKKKGILLWHGNMPAYTDESWNILAEVIRTTTTLEKLMFQRGAPIALQHDEVVDALANNRTIKILELWAVQRRAVHGGYRDEGAKAVAAILKENSTIEVVNLKNSHISVEGAKAIAEALKHNKKLRCINLPKNRIGYEGAKAIADALKENTSSLQKLLLGNNNIGEEGGKQILNALQHIDSSAIENIVLIRGGKQMSNETLAKIKWEIIRINSSVAWEWSQQRRFKIVGASVGQAVAIETTDGIQGDEKNASSSNEDEQLTTIHPTNASRGDGIAESDKESNEPRHNIKTLETKIRELQSTIASQQAELAQKDGDIKKLLSQGCETTKMRELQSTIAKQQAELAQKDGDIAKKDGDIAQLHNELALKQEEIAFLMFDRSQTLQQLEELKSGSEVLGNYMKCCVCLEPYDEGLTSSGNQRLPIKSATCAHSLCEGCLDDYHASLMNVRSTLRYVRCPQCNDKTKKAFDIQNKVVDLFLREYIQCRKRKRPT